MITFTALERSSGGGGAYGRALVDSASALCWEWGLEWVTQSDPAVDSTTAVVLAL